jgi:hypothetical protein
VKANQKVKDNKINKHLAQKTASIQFKLFRKYILKKRMNPNLNNISLITDIVLEYINSLVLPKDVVNSTVIHLRLGDVVAGDTEHEKEKRPYDINYIKSLVKNDATKKYVIGKCFFAQPSSTNYEECIRLSDVYLKEVLRELNAEHFDSGDADIDLCCAVKAKVFVKGKGYYSCLIAEIRKKLNLETI